MSLSGVHWTVELTGAASMAAPQFAGYLLILLAGKICLNILYSGIEYTEKGFGAA